MEKFGKPVTECEKWSDDTLDYDHVKEWFLETFTDLCNNASDF